MFALKVVKSDSKIIILGRYSKSVTHSVYRPSRHIMAAIDPEINKLSNLHFFQESKHLLHGTGNPRCLDCDVKRSKIFLRQCDAKSLTQKWNISKVNKDALAKWNKL